MDDNTAAQSHDSEEMTHSEERVWSYKQGKETGWSMAWAEAMRLVKSEAAAEYITNGDTPAARRLRDICMNMVHLSSKPSPEVNKG